MDNPLRILYLDDSTQDRELVRSALLKENAQEYILTEAASCQEFEAQLKAGKFDLVLSDFNILGFDGLEVLDRVQALDATLPVIIITGSGNEEVAVEAMKRGASDYVIKTSGHIRNLPRTMRAVLENITERKRAEEALLASEAKYRTLVENIPHKILTKDRNHVFVSCSPNYAQDLGISPEQFAGHTDYDFYPKEMAEQFREDDRRILKTGITEVIEEKNLHNGQEIWVQTVKTPIRGKNGEITGILVIFEDITERKRAQEELYQSRQMLQLVLDNIPQRVFWKDRTLTYLGSNKSHAADAGLDSTNDMIGKSDFDFPWKEMAALYQVDDRLVMENDAPKLNFEEPLTKTDGSQSWLRTSKVPLHDQEGNVIGVLGTYEDITDRKRSEEALARSHSELLRSNADLKLSAQELLLLNQASQAFNSTLDLDQVLQTVLEMLSKRIEGTSSFWLVDAETGALICRQAHGPHSQSVVGSQLNPGEGMVGWVALHGRRLVISDLQSDPQREHFTEAGHEFARSVLIVPIRSKEKVIGILQLLDAKAGTFDVSGTETVESLASIAAVAIENARLYARVEQLAIRDELTGLRNRRGFYLMAEQLMKQAERLDSKLALIYMDVDDFKHINDTFGHKSGDQALVAIANYLRRAFRSSDIVARIGGDEFTILANVSNAYEAAFILQRLRANVLNGDIRCEAGGTLSMSIGHELWDPHSACTLDQLLTQADAAMYQEKVEKKRQIR